ncbi:MAG: DUF2325 domain-containing protein [Burkholderiales bacterium]|nr:DUF2325 domain-containing protein [Burkholderiales bacterium]
MCKTDETQLALLARPAPIATPVAGPQISPTPTPRGSRRTRLWELDTHAHCPVVGVCLPIGVLRKLVDKALGGQAVADDYELHCGAVADCKHRGAIAEAVQRELDRRYALALKAAARLKTTDALAAWWSQALRAQDIAGPFWATLTHPRCTPGLAKQAEGEVHMLQHQVGAATRADHEQLQTLRAKVGALTGELAAAAQHAHRQAQEHARRTEALEATILQLRARLMARETAMATLQTLEAAAPDLRSRMELTREVEQLHRLCSEQQRALLQSQEEAQRQRCRANELHDALQRTPPRSGETLPTDGADAHALTGAVGERAVLCVGGRPASVPIYRQLIEQTGGSFLHHDGGEEDNPARLDATLAAADLVICQTGCISHAAYWRVKDHCKRTGKRCIFVESPSSTGLKRALLTLAPAGADGAVNAA